MAGWLKTEFLMMRGKLHLRRKNYEAALKCYREVTQLRPQYAMAFAKLGYCLAALERYQDAAVAFGCALQIRPDFTSVNAHLSLALERLGDTRIASEYLERALPRPC